MAKMFLPLGEDGGSPFDRQNRQLGPDTFVSTSSLLQAESSFPLLSPALGGGSQNFPKEPRRPARNRSSWLTSLKMRAFKIGIALIFLSPPLLPCLRENFKRELRFWKQDLTRLSWLLVYFFVALFWESWKKQKEHGEICPRSVSVLLSQGMPIEKKEKQEMGYVTCDI